MNHKHWIRCLTALCRWWHYYGAEVIFPTCAPVMGQLVNAFGWQARLTNARQQTNSNIWAQPTTRFFCCFFQRRPSSTTRRVAHSVLKSRWASLQGSLSHSKPPPLDVGCEGYKAPILGTLVAILQDGQQWTRRSPSGWLGEDSPTKKQSKKYWVMIWIMLKKKYGFYIATKFSIFSV